MLANVHRDPEKTPAYQAEHFHPYKHSPGKAARGTPLTGNLIRERAARWRAEQAAKIRVETSS